MKKLDLIEQFIEQEVERRADSLLPKSHPYIKSAAKALAAVRNVRKQLAAAKELKTAAQAVEEGDSLHGYGADDDGYNRLAAMKEAAYEVKL
jgi:hypothetical protein